MVLARASHSRPALASSGGLQPWPRNSGAGKQAPPRVPARPQHKASKLFLPAPLAAAASQFGLLPQGPATEEAAATTTSGVEPEACPKKLAAQTWDWLLATLSILLIVTCCPLGLLFAALLSLSSLALDFMCQVVVSLQLDPLYTLGPLTFGVMRWLRSDSVRRTVGTVHGAAKRCRRLAGATLRSLQIRGFQRPQLPPRKQ